MTEVDLAELRGALAQVDGEIRAGIARRLALARKIGEVKRGAGLPVRDFAAERGVLERWREELAKVEVPPERAEALARWLIEEAVFVQERQGTGRPATSGRSSDVLVIGGAGAMGAWMCEFLRAGGHRVGIFDPKADLTRQPGYAVHTDLARAAQDADVVLVATPMRAAPAIYRELLKTESEGVIFDILSLKQPLVPWIRRGVSAGFHLTSVHPLFGPQARTLSGRNLLVLDCGDPRANARAHQLFGASSLRITEMPLEHHDLLMSETLALPHLLALLFGSVLSQVPRPPGELAHAAPTSFLRQLEASQVIAAENPELSFDIQTLNPSSEALFDRIERSVKDLRRLLKEGDPKAYRRQLQEVRGVLDREGAAPGSKGEGSLRGGAPRTPPGPRRGPPPPGPRS